MGRRPTRAGWKLPVTPQDRFAPVPPEQRDVIEVWLQPRIAVTNETVIVEPEGCSAG